MRSINKAIILAAGKGKRMGGLTSELPKPMLRVNNKPVLEHIVRNLAAAGVKSLLVITGYKAEVIEKYFDDGGPWNCSIRYTRQTTQDGTGKVVELGIDFAGDDPFLLVYGDILVEPRTYVELIKNFINKEKASGIVMVKLEEDVAMGAVMLFDEQFRLKDLIEKPTLEQLKKLQADRRFKRWYNAGLYAFTPSLFSYVKTLKKSVRGEYELTDAIRALAKETRSVYGVEIKGYWIDVRDPELLAQAQSVVRSPS